jgi:hypothetical protein
MFRTKKKLKHIFEAQDTLSVHLKAPALIKQRQRTGQIVALCVHFQTRLNFNLGSYNRGCN